MNLCVNPAKEEVSLDMIILSKIQTGNRNKKKKLLKFISASLGLYDVPRDSST